MLACLLLAGCASAGHQASSITLGMSIADAEAVLSRHRAELSTAVPWSTSVRSPEYVQTYVISEGRLLTVFFNRKLNEVCGMGVCRPSPGSKGFTERCEVHRIELPRRRGTVK
jgi:hypothetical protein